MAGAPATFAVSFSYADSRSTVCRYFADSGLDDAAAVIASLPMVSISERGGRILVHATGVGAPRSDRTVTIASPMPSKVRAFSRS